MLNVSNAFKEAVYAPIRKITARIHFTLNGSTKTYDDDFIIRASILEEMNTINETLPSNEAIVTLENTNGEFNILNLQRMQEIIASRPKIQMEFGLVYEDESIEWVPMGTYFLVEWKNEVAAMSISLIGRDNFDMLSQISYNNTAGNNLYNLAADILQKAGIVDFTIDNSLKSINTNGFLERLDSRTALQHIGIASRSAVFQDRYGKVIIKPFTAMDASSNYLSYAGQPLHYFGAVYPLTTNGSGMKNIGYDNVFEEPEISLDKSIYEVVVNVYGPGDPREIIRINTSINGQNGSSFKIDNPLINTDEMAIKVADWIIKESNYNAIYKTVWRQNPALECADMVLVEDSFQAMKQTRIFRQEYQYEGYLKGVTESKGGI
ncbi:hypothetical protein [Mesobacillus subterraneus]|uniref:DUF5048 domain-containing protein n=1 Tax=Mesobacillus subterraneus TaxID=285983 RepID=A0A3R9ET87_9BACI|nr:hypothetical protein [Mesobacillus subterraneus]RSD21083.1 hypothetical protein EJA10_22560 [Mesobacillus subterraneus]